MVQQAAMMTAAQPLAVASPALGASAPAMTKAQPQQEAPPVVYLYYDARQLQTNAQGQVVLPNQLYDAQGRVVDTQMLVQQQQGLARNVYLEPPPHRGMAAPALTLEAPVPPVQATAQVQGAPAVEATTTTAEAPPMAGVASTTTSSNQSDNSIYDQSIMVSTVGIMALLVGAISARRLRSRSHWLQVCIENESLEDDVAYDDAHTIVGENSDYGTYNTFGWKGDLEKFDV